MAMLWSELKRWCQLKQRYLSLQREIDSRCFGDEEKEEMTVEELRKAVIQSAEALYQLNIKDVKWSDVDTPSNKLITRLFDDNGWDNWLRDPKGGKCPLGYTRPPDPDYCGHTAAAIYRGVEKQQVSTMRFNRKFSEKILASTRRLADLGLTQWADYGLERIEVEPEQLQPGDLAVVITSAKKSYGDHIVVIRNPPNLEEGTVDTYEGNATGILPDGKKGKGIVITTRKLAHVRQAFPLQLAWFDQQ